MLLGSGLKGQGGAALVYRSSRLLGGWELEGLLCAAATIDTGAVWECPLLVPLAPLPRSPRPAGKHVSERVRVEPCHHCCICSVLRCTAMYC